MESVEIVGDMDMGYVLILWIRIWMSAVAFGNGVAISSVSFAFLEKVESQGVLVTSGIDMAKFISYLKVFTHKQILYNFATFLGTVA